MPINLIRTVGQHPEEVMHTEPPSTTRIQEEVLLDDRLKALRGPLETAGFEVTLLPADQRGTVPLRCPERGPRPPILITGRVREWLKANPDPMTLGASLINVAAILGHPEGCAAVLLRAMADPNVPAHDLFWMDFSPDGRRHLILFAMESE